FGDVDLLAPPIGKADVLDGVLGGNSHVWGSSNLQLGIVCLGRSGRTVVVQTGPHVGQPSIPAQHIRRNLI
ncbi:MAG: hypothetical protein WBB38_14475, partial [Hyphomicrobiaceae bacterium]